MLMMDLKLNLDALEIPVPRYFREEEKTRLDERDRFLVSVSRKSSVSDLG
jgi:hypothetical protein